MTLKYIKTQEEFKANESVIKTADNIFKVKVTVDVPKSLVSAVSKKVKDVKGPDILDTFSQTEIAEELVKYVTQTFLNIDSIPASVLTGEETIEGETPADGLPTSEETPITPEGNTMPIDTPGEPLDGASETGLPTVTIED